MDKSGAEAYVYAKACGKLGKSFIESRTENLFQVKSLSELWSLIFNTQPPFVPEILLAEEIEKTAFSTFIKSYSDFISNFDNPDKILIYQLLTYEAENLKEISAILSNKGKKLPELIDIGKFSTLNISKWPDIKAITEKSIFSWYNYVPDIHEQLELEFKLDNQVTNFLWNALNSTSSDSKKILMDYFIEEYSLKNIIWALRLKINYGMDEKKILKYLIRIPDIENINDDPFAKPVLKILEKRIDVYDDWEKWKYSSLLNPYEKGNVWKINPGYIEKNARVALNKKALHIFHQYPMTTASLVAWFKIKDFELSCIRTAVERLRLNINSDDALKVIGLNNQNLK